jgi:hypothetical protein
LGSNSKLGWITFQEELPFRNYLSGWMTFFHDMGKYYLTVALPWNTAAAGSVSWFQVSVKRRTCIYMLYSRTLSLWSLQRTCDCICCNSLDVWINDLIALLVSSNQ